LLEAFAAEHRAALGWTEGDCGVFPTLRAVSFRFRTDLQAAHDARSGTLGSSGFASFTTFWFVLEAFVGEEHLFARSENELGAALRTFQDPIVKFHEALP
jgi:hypothetical protein